MQLTVTYLISSFGKKAQLTCHGTCASCHLTQNNSRSVRCDSCKDKTRLIQGHRCVRHCESGWFQDGRICKKCHVSCGECVYSGPKGCQSCRRGLYLTQYGTCEARCTTGFYPLNGLCIPCEAGCPACSTDGICDTEYQSDQSRFGESSRDITITVIENQNSVLLSDHFDFAPPNVDPKKIVYHIVQPFNPEDGLLINTDKPTHNLQKFTQNDLLKARIVFTPARSANGQTSLLTSVFTVSHPEKKKNKRKGVEHKLTVRLVPGSHSDSKFVEPFPRVYVEQGGTTHLPSDYFKLSGTALSGSDLEITITDMPRHGFLTQIFESGENLMQESLELGDFIVYDELADSTLLYQHDGSSNLDDSFEITVSDGKIDAVNRILFIIFPTSDSHHIQSAAALQDANIGHSLQILEGESIILPSFDTGLVNDMRKEIQNYTLLVEPQFGTLYKLTGTTTQKITFGQTFPVSDVVDGRILFAADSEIGPDPVQEIMKLELEEEIDPSKKELEIVITIGPVNSQPPQVIVNSELTVDEGRKEILSPDVLTIEDMDTPVSLLEIRLDSPPSFGYLMQRNLDDSGTVEAKSSAFPVQALLDEQLVYVQNDHLGKEPNEDFFLFHIFDGKQSSSTVKLSVIIERVNDEPPVAATEPLFTEIGGAAIVNNVTFFVSDLDTKPFDLVVTLSEAPKIGVLKRQDSVFSESSVILREGSSIAYQDFIEGLIVYVHSGGSESKQEDSMAFKVSDGDFSSHAQLQVLIGKVNTDLPAVKVNKGLLLPIGTHLVISNLTLLAESSSLDDCLYTVTQISPNLILEKSQSSRWNPISEMGEFNQSDINTGRIRLSVLKTDSFMEFFFFEVKDARDPVLADQSFVVEVILNEAPIVMKNRKVSLKLNEDEPLSEDHLFATDSESESDELIYEVKEIPANLRISHVDYPDLDVFQWSQSDINQKKILFRAVSYGQDLLKLSLTDGFNQVDTELVIVVMEDEKHRKWLGTKTFIEFGAPELLVGENASYAKIPVVRTGDKTSVSSTICHTIPSSANEKDFIPRLFEEKSRIFFLKGVETIHCEVEIINDSVFEEEEVFDVVLSIPEPEESVILKSNKVRVVIRDPEDLPRLKFEKVTHTVIEPSIENIRKSFSVKLIRLGDTSKPMDCHAKSTDGSAVENLDYILRTKSVHFKSGEALASIDVEIMHNSDSSWQRTFSIVVESMHSSAEANITIVPQRNSALPILPAEPIVVSLVYLDNITEGLGIDPRPGYPLICITACDPKYPNYNETSSLCRRTNIGLTRYTWEVAPPSMDPIGISSFYEVVDSTLFTDARGRILDPIYFNKLFKVRCVTQPIVDGGILGAPIKSKPVSISEAPTCTRAGEPYKASVNITEDRIVHMKVEIPFQDGSIPLISTMPLYSVQYLLTQSIYRTQHICSDLHPGFGFLADINVNLDLSDSVLTGNTRSESASRLYKHLNLKTCLWTFEAKFTLSDLIDKCGGVLSSILKVDAQGRDRIVTRLPLHISLVEALPPYGWSTVEYSTELEVGLEYDPILWHKGLETKPALVTKPQVTRIASDRDGRLVVEFRTYSSFSGYYVTKNSLGKTSASFISPPGVTTPFNLTLTWTKNTVGGVEQSWKAVSLFSLNDYSGDYQLRLVPCVFNQDMSQSPERCEPQDPVSMPLSVAFKHAHRTVPAIYSLNTEFTLSKNNWIFSEDGSDDPNNLEASEEEFDIGDSIYGRVRWSPSQALDASYSIKIQRVYVCAGRDGYIPSYDPSGSVYKDGPQYGCLENSPKLRHRLLLLDREEPRATDKVFEDVPVEAAFASEHPELITTTPLNTGLDGFVMKVDPLYRVKSGNVWFIQVIYTITATYHRQRRDLANEGSEIIRQGTNIKCIRLAIVDDYIWLKASIILLTVPLIGGLILGLCGYLIYKTKKRRKKIGICEIPECEPLSNTSDKIRAKLEA
ncbi:extracellular matrix organizing protein FRAS1-like isoform X3 [Artemia franciscana]|uniref:extracellular matrix organizing protein FRAS1-like isoform X3 n=1 Tax=Artemia franciscana TaxID=6661 RepID=UPI0032DB6008